MQPVNRRVIDKATKVSIRGLIVVIIFSFCCSNKRGKLFCISVDYTSLRHKVVPDSLWITLLQPLRAPR